MKLDHIKQINQQSEDEEFSLKSLVDRKQQMNESLIEYGTTLTKMVKKLLPTVNTQNPTQILEKQFIDGLQNRDTAEKVMLKLYEKKSKKKHLSKDETIELARHVENAYITTRKLNNRNNAIVLQVLNFTI